MILQEIFFDENEDIKLFFRIKGIIGRGSNSLILAQNTVFSTDTYYNSFSIGKWKEYCIINKVSLGITLQGEAEVSIIHSNFIEDKRFESKVISSYMISEPQKKEIWIELPNICCGTIHFIIRSLSDKTQFYGAVYNAEDTKEREVNIALNICTYHREKYLFKNIDLFQKNFIENKESPLYGHLKIFIIDNGGTIDIEAMATSDIYIFHNPNVGGAGGFSRGLLEISKKKEQEHITNAIFMDDDIEILPEAIIRTYRILKIIKEEYVDVFLAGAMLRQDYRYIQFENTACWNGGEVYSFNQGLDLREYKNVVYNEIEKKSEYGAWWYCCIPAQIITADNLAIPVFIHIDDVEYSLRNTSKFLTLNGISVVHPVIGQKLDSAKVYYDFRNMLIVNAKYYPNYKRLKVKKELLRRMLEAYFHYRYRDVKLLYKAVKDFCRGPEWLMSLDAVVYHTEIEREGYQFEDVTNIIGKKIPFYIENDTPCVDYFGRKQRRWTIKKIVKLFIIIFTLNGACLPSKEKKAFEMTVSPAKLFRHNKIVLFDKVSMQGIFLQRDIKKIFELIWYFWKSCVKINKHYHLVQTHYAQTWDMMHGQFYWNKVFFTKV